MFILWKMRYHSTRIIEWEHFLSKSRLSSGLQGLFPRAGINLTLRLDRGFAEEEAMISRRMIIPAVLILTILAQLMPGAVFGPQAASAVTRCDWAQFIADVTVPDGTSFAPGTAFTKTWRLKNIGTCTWTTSYALVFVSGSQMGAPSVINLPSSVAPGATVDLSVNMTAPATSGSYRGYWQLRNASGVLFGIGTYANKSFWVDIKVSTGYATGYDFVANYCSATWTSAAGILPCPGTDGDAKGFVLKIDNPRLENGVTDTSPGLLTFPQNVTNGYIQGIYPAFTVQTGDRFQSIVNCQYNATSCYVTFRLDYQIGSGPVKTFWTFKEKYEGLYYRANLDLSSLAGQNVKFILTILASGSPSGDRALWGAPRIVRASSIPPTPTPTATGTPPTPTATPIPSACDRATFIADISIPDGTTFTGGTPFTKTWRLKNVGTCTWTTSYALVFFSGDAMSAIPVIYLPASVAPGQMINLSAAMTAPNASGHYRGYWKLRNASNVKFGIGPYGADPFWVDINVTSAFSTAYDFYTNACSATWTSGAGALPCPGTDGAANGFILKLDAPYLEDGTIGQPGLLTFPQNVTNGYIQGIYPPFTVQSGDRFQSIINCQYNATSCNVVFRLDYQIGGGAVQTFKSASEKYEGMYYRLDLDLSPLAGQSVKFILTVLANGSPTGDRALWGAPRIARTP